MKLDIDDSQIELLLKTVAVAHIVEYLKGNDNSDLEKLLQKISCSLKEENKMEIFNRVFEQVQRW